MVRFSLLLVAVALAAGTSGCAHCDTCDDFPTPCLDQMASFGAPAGAIVVADGTPAPTMLPTTSGSTTPAAPSGTGTPATPPPTGGSSPYGTGASLEPIPGSNGPGSKPVAGVSLGNSTRRSN